jgi:hypothetical protein
MSVPFRSMFFEEWRILGGELSQIRRRQHRPACEAPSKPIRGSGFSPQTRVSSDDFHTPPRKHAFLQGFLRFCLAF